MSVTSWFLVSSSGTRHRLPREMIFVGREDCELMLQSRSVDKQHAVINYDSDKDEHRVKDLGSLNGTFINDVRIPDQKYITLKLSDNIRFGYDINLYVLEQIQHQVPEEALKHEKYTSHLQMCLKTSAVREDQFKEQGAHVDSSQAKQADKKSTSDVPAYRTPLYGQPSWWGEDDDHKLEKEGRRQDEHYSERPKDMTQHEEEVSGNMSYRDAPDQCVYPFRREPSYFEIPTKDFQQPVKPPETQVYEIPTKDTDVVPPVTPPVMQSHASFTIEFDDCQPGKIKIKDHVTKFSMRQRKTAGKEPGPTDMVSAESKVADWLVQNDPSLIRRPSPGEDVYSTKSDLPIHNRTLKGNRHEDGTQSDSEDPLVAKPEIEIGTTDHPQLQRQIKREPEELLHSQQAFVIEFFDDDAPRKKRSQSFTHNADSPQNDTDPVLKAKADKRKGTLQVEKVSTNGTGSSAPASKSLSSPSFPQRSNSFRREKTEDRISSAPTTARLPGKNYGSVGKKSKLAQEFAAEYMHEQAEVFKQAAEKPMTLPLSTSILQQPAPQVQMSSQAQTMQLTSDVRPGKMKNEEEDNLSDAGTYTIETETQDREVEQARKMIDQVFGVFEPDEYSKISSTVYRPVIKLGKEEPFASEPSALHKPIMSLSTPPIKLSNGLQAETLIERSGSNSKSGQKWVSRWASLADSYPDASPTSPLDNQKQGLIADDEDVIERIEVQGEADPTVPSRTRRLLPQLPPENLMPAIFVCQESLSSESQRKSVEEPEKGISAENSSLLLVQEELDPDSLSDTSKSDDGVISVRKSVKASNTYRNGWNGEEFHSREPSVQRTSVPSSEKKSTCFYVGNDDVGSVKQTTSGLSSKDLIKNQESHINLKPNLHSSVETPSSGRIVNQFHKKDNGSAKEPLSFVRQESFTKEKSSSNVSSNKLPHISTHPLLKDLSVTKPSHDYSQETRLILKETETALAALEAKLFTQSHLDELENTPCLRDDSLSGESDVDTASTVSLVSDKNAPSHSQKNRVVNLQKEKSSSTSSIQEPYCQPSARARLSEKRRTVPADAGTRNITKRQGMTRSTGARGSLDFTDEERCSSLPYMPVSETVSSDYENSSSRHISRRKPFAQTCKDESSRSSNAQKVHQALTRSNSLSTPRPTRASKLRRARLGESSDNECADVERSNISPGTSSANSSSAKSSTEPKKPSRLDILAMPRKRTGSFNVPSDSETSSSVRAMFSGRSVDQSYTNRKPAVAESKQPLKKPVALPQKQTPSRARSSSVKYSSSSTSRRRQQGSDYVSTSEEECGSNHSTPKHKHSRASTATQTSRSSSVSRHHKSSSRQNKDEDEQEVYNNFMAQSVEIAEIARLSQTLVKDVASLAREIHDVAGDGDSQSSSGTGQSTSISSVPNTPASTISAREEIIKRSVQRTCSSQLVHHIPEASLNYQKIPPGSTGLEDFDQNMNDSREDPSKRRARNIEEVIFDNLMLNPVSQLSHTICANTEVLTEKMKMLFQNKEKNWEEIEAKINSENEVPILKTSNKEISSILKELRRVQKQLEVINAIIDRSGHLEVTTSNKKTSSTLLTSNPLPRTTYNSAARTESQTPGHLRNYIHKSSSSSSRSPGSSFSRDDEETYIV
ncbi:centrosomal protein of 170 kDa protein B isoform X2 [Xenopus laevis]|uniref:Centrosomal protein of 170 kDa protein B isoform X2 n=2 Tax=Xenopus laevis TaxID=8355 RepID=A0A1L8FA41_XENLA|nr:centrosomal protein of 170 kDa protein B isoform X2 [Xenopus laevis]OCT68452.1 hypothetical protein XELAEV_18039753mg [Xenopus laevis]